MFPISKASSQVVQFAGKALHRRTLSLSCCSNTKKYTIEKVAVIGGGTMGSGISQMFAQSGIPVTVVDTDEYAQRCLVRIRKDLQVLSDTRFHHEPRAAEKFINDVLGCIRTTQSHEDAMKDADLVIEAVIEALPIKQNIFKQIDALAPKHTIFSSNTSSLSIEEIGELTSRKDRFLGLHFFNPVRQRIAVEVITTPATSPQVVGAIEKILKEVGRVPVRCKENKDNAGFIVNSLNYPFLMSAVRLHESGIATVENIDKAIKLGMGLDYGPFEMIDIIGIDDLKFVIDRWHEKFPGDPRYFPSSLLDRMAGQNKLGRKTGYGFYPYRLF